jgi:hypothetical protein
VFMLLYCAFRPALTAYSAYPSVLLTACEAPRHKAALIRCILPHTPNMVLSDRLIWCQNHHAIDDGLANEQAIKGVPV